MYLEPEYITITEMVPITHRSRRQTNKQTDAQEMRVSMDVTEGGQSTPQQAVTFLAERVSALVNLI